MCIGSSTKCGRRRRRRPREWPQFMWNRMPSERIRFCGEIRANVALAARPWINADHRQRIIDADGQARLSENLIRIGLSLP